MSATGSNRNAGFTLLEMLVVVGITALIAGLGFPAIAHMQAGASFTSATRLTELAVRQARADAVRTGTAVRFTVSDDGTALLVPGRPREQLPPPARLQGPAQGITFFADGSASGGEITLVAGNRVRRFGISQDSGAIESRS